MYGVESCVHPDYQGRGVGSKLMDARFDVLSRLNLRGMVAGSIFMDYHKAAQEISPQDYVREVIQGQRYDTNLTKQLHKGFRVQNLIPNYIDDMRTLNWAAAIVWDNPDYRPDGVARQRAQPGRYPVSLKRQPTPAVARGL